MDKISSKTTINVLTLQNNSGAQSLKVEAGTTVCEVARLLKIENPENVKAMDDLNKPLGPNTPLMTDSFVNFLESVSGA